MLCSCHFVNFAFFVVQSSSYLLYLRSRVFENIQPALDPVRHIDQTVGIDVKIVEHRRLLSFGRRWNKKAYFLGAEFVSDIKDAQAGVVISNENDVLALKRPGTHLMHVVRPETQAALAEVAFRHRAGADDYRIALFSDIDEPNPLLSLGAVIFDRLVDGDDQFSAGQRQSCMRVAAERRTPVDVTDGFW